jgi:Sulfotransferase family
MTPAIHSAMSTPANGQPRHEPIFLLAPARSYSTVTVALLAGHPDIYGFPEMLLFTADTVGGLLNQNGIWRQKPILAWNRHSGIVRAVADLLEGSQESCAISRANEWLAKRSSWSPVELMDHLLCLIDPKIGLEKSPDTVASEEALDACIDHYPRSRYIHLTRHPVGTIRSTIEYWRVFGHDHGTLVASAASSWYKSHARIVHKLNQLPSQGWLRIRAEDVVGDPVTWLPYILDWLGLQHDNEIISQMTQTQNWRFAGTGQSGKLRGGDAKFMRSPALRPIPRPVETAFDPSWGLIDEMCNRMTSLASHLGY